MSVKLHYQYSTPSTQMTARVHLKHMRAGVLYKFVASEQSNGQGTKGKSWQSPVGGFYTSYAWLGHHWLNPAFSVDLASGISRFLNDCGIPSVVKIPNDIIVDHKKLAGILIEQEKINNHVAVIVGLGMNVMVKIESDQPTCSLSEYTNMALEDVEFMIDKVIWTAASQVGALI
ncbi:MAG: biotin--[acetyl-CoA-carboxylase] ligase [Gammaproteobacteria bacterium]|nr:biotin--[acetyl-CoA-carboxylase] ligase [Gammaproteobacteria bacterium]